MEGLLFYSKRHYITTVLLDDFATLDHVNTMITSETRNATPTVSTESYNSLIECSTKYVMQMG